MGAQTHAIGIGDPHTAGHHVVGHARELVDAVHGEDATTSTLFPTHAFHQVDRDRPEVGPGHVGEQSERAIEVQCAGLGEAMREKMQTQVHVDGVGGRGVGVGHDALGGDGHATQGVVLWFRGALGRRRDFAPTERVEPRVENGAVGDAGDEGVAPGCGHVWLLRGRLRRLRVGEWGRG